MAGILHKAGCCCDQCENCEDGVPTPAQFRITLSSVVLCSGCNQSDADGRYYKWTTNPAPALAASYDLDQLDKTSYGICKYRNTVAFTAGTIKQYSDAGCTTETASRDIDTMYIDLEVVFQTVGNPKMTLFISIPGGWIGLIIFADYTTTTATPCGGTTVLTNEQTDCTMEWLNSGWVPGYSGGTISAVAI